MATEYAWRIYHPASGRSDGWYFRESDATDVYDYFKTEWPKERFELLAIRSEADWFPLGQPALRPVNSSKWARK